tara:strand:- start:702 stop:1061 length:360 start_codon:yes stop_codon:yes gene_type:complete
MKKILVAALCCILSINCYANPPIFKTDYKEAVKVSTALEQDLILIFTASWCGPCKNLKKDLTKYSDLFKDTTICIIDIDKDPNLAGKYGVNKVPYSIFYSKGKEIKRVTGYSTIDKYRK